MPWLAYRQEQEYGVCQYISGSWCLLSAQVRSRVLQRWRKLCVHVHPSIQTFLCMVSAAEERTFCNYSLATCVYVEAIVNPFTAEDIISALGQLQVWPNLKVQSLMSYRTDFKEIRKWFFHVL